MGVKDLWTIISPLSERKPLYELEGKTIAIDLSCWVVDSQNIHNTGGQPKMYIRNLYFRTSYFLLNNINPVFVLEGTAPTLKHNTIAKRNEIARPGAGNKKTVKKVGRTHFNTVLKECKEMLGYMGLTCIQAEGEAEALCAYLNADGLVDGCISQDSDCFLYGAKVVYRNFCTVKNGGSGFIDEYTIEKIENVHGLSRNKMVALALICGCDYGDGLHGVGKENALKFFKTVTDDEVLDRMKDWRTSSICTKIEEKLANPDICTNCGHLGKKTHARKGCEICGTTTKCHDTFKQKCATMSGELAIRKKALADETFPNQEIISEFLIRKETVPASLDQKWNKPNIVKFVGFMERVVEWEPNYAFEKILPIVTRWQMKNLVNVPEEERSREKNIFIPEKINKIRVVKGTACFEVQWQDKDDVVGKLRLLDTGDKENDHMEREYKLVTLEPQDLTEKCYPKLVEEYDERTRAQANKNVKRVREPKKPKKPKNDVAKNKKITEYMAMKELEDSFEKLVMSPQNKKKKAQADQNIAKEKPEKKKRGPQIDRVMTIEKIEKILDGSMQLLFEDLGPEDFPTENDIPDTEMSVIINDIVSR